MKCKIKKQYFELKSEIQLNCSWAVILWRATGGGRVPPVVTRHTDKLKLKIYGMRMRE